MPGSTGLMKTLTSLFDRIAREPVLVGAAVQAQLLATWPDASPVARLAIAAWVALFQRVFSTSNRAAAENVETAKYVGAVEHQAIAAVGQIVAAAPPAPPG